ncbi:MAG: hypothetical protein ABR910_16845 [Acidobacteriaceae bacterium]|jgi:hypothetical protein
MQDNLGSPLDKIPAQLQAINNSLQEQIGTVRDTAEANRQTQEKIQANLSELRVPEDEKREERSYRKKNYTVQVVLAAGTCGAFLAAAIYAGIAKRQLQAMNKTYGEIRKQTKAAEGAAYAACINAQIARGTLLQVQSGSEETRDMTISSAYQAAASTQSQIAQIALTFKDPPTVKIGQAIGIPFFINNSGSTSGYNFNGIVRAEFMPRGDDPSFTYPIKGELKMSAARVDGSFAPNTHTAMAYAVDQNGTAIKATQTDVDDYAAGRKDMLIYGKLSYIDMFHIKHWRRFCTASEQFASPEAASTGHQKCADYNQNDTNTILYKPQSPLRPPDQIPEISCPKPAD